MPRKRAVLSDDVYTQASSDESFKAPARTTNSRAKRVAPKTTTKSKSHQTKRAKIDVQESDADEVVAAGDSGLPHATGLHIVTDPEPIRGALLQWYGKVHEARGMPWRKPYNPNLSDEDRSQRAYEVRLPSEMLCVVCWCSRAELCGRTGVDI